MALNRCGPMLILAFLTVLSSCNRSEVAEKEAKTQEKSEETAFKASASNGESEVAEGIHDLQKGGMDSLSVDAVGGVGIGTTEPSAKLRIAPSEGRARGDVVARMAAPALAERPPKKEGYGIAGGGVSADAGRGGTRGGSSHELPMAASAAPARKGGYYAGAPQKRSRKMARPVAPVPTADKNGWYQNTYLGGSGDRESLQKAVENGVVVDGEKVQLAAFTGNYTQDFPFPTGSSLGITTRTDRDAMLPDGGSVFLEVGFQAASTEAGERPPLNVMMVIDRSGSMKKEGKIEAVRAAALEVVKRLEPRDQLGIVTYSRDASLQLPIAPVRDPAKIKSMIQSIYANGGTNIYSGLEMGYQELAKVSRPHSGNLLILLTDGQVTAGERRQERFEALVKGASDKDVETSTIGMGVSYNEGLMMAVSRAGAGNYHFIKDSSDVASVISAEVDDLSNALARGVRLRVELADNVDLVRILGSEQLSKAQVETVKADERKIDQKVYEELGIKKDRKKQDEPGIKMLIPAFKANDSHVVLMELRVPSGAGTRQLAKVEVKYKDVPRRKNEKVLQAVKVKYAKDKASSIASINRSVKKNILGFQTGEALMAAARLIDRHDVSGAVRKIDDQMVLLGVAAREWKDEDLERDATMLGKYKGTLTRYGQGRLNRELAAYLGKSFSYSAYQRLK